MVTGSYWKSGSSVNFMYITIIVMIAVATRDFYLSVTLSTES